MPTQLKDSLTETLIALKSLKNWPAGWNGNDVAAPKAQAIDFALRFTRELYKETSCCSAEWREPHVTATEEGNVLLEWWHNEKSLSLYISENQIHYIKDWGADILNEMEDGAANSSVKRHALWTWLNET